MTITIPETMKAAVSTGFGGIDEHVYIENVPVPKPSKGELLVKILACALAPGDVRVLSGKTDWVQLPKSGFPYIIGGDTAGFVVECGADTETKFHPGDYVVSRFELPGPHGGLAEYRVVQAALTEKCPMEISPVDACGLVASAMSAKKLVQTFVKKGDRVLVIGGSGAVGTSLLQYNKLNGVRYLAAVSTQSELCKSLGADNIIDYRTQNWWQVDEYHDEKFDVVFDLVSGGNWEDGGRSGKAVKAQGYYVTLPPGVQSEIIFHNVLDLIKLMFDWHWSPLWTRLSSNVPRRVIAQTLDLEEDDLAGLLDDVKQGRLRPVLDPSSPFQFTEDDVRKAMKVQKSTHAHGKVVVQVSKQ